MYVYIYILYYIYIYIIYSYIVEYTKLVLLLEAPVCFPVPCLALSTAQAAPTTASGD